MLFRALVLSIFSFLAGPLPAQEPRIELIHFWVAKSEQDALGVFRDAVTDKGVVWNELPLDGNREKLQVQLASLISLGTPPSIVHWVADGQLKELVESGVFRGIPDADGRYRDLYVPEVYEQVTMGGDIVSVPVGIHSYNFLMYNRAKLAEYGLEPPQSMDEMIADGKTLRENGDYLAVFADKGWHLRYLLIAAAATLMTPEEFVELVTDGQDVSHLTPTLQAMFTQMREVLQVSRIVTEEITWRDTVTMLEEGQALVLMMGDFAVPQLTDQDAILCAQVPQSTAMYVGFDSFAFMATDRADLLAGQEAFLEVTTDPATVTDFVNLKGGLPTIRGVDPGDLAPCHADNLIRWGKSEKIWVRTETTNRRYGVLATFLEAEIENRFDDPAAVADRLVRLFNTFY